MTRADGAASTTSGRSATMRSICASSTPPSLGNAGTLAGQFEYRSVPTSRAQPPNAHTLSVNDGSRLTMRCGGAASTSVAPRSSRSVIRACAAIGNSTASSSAATDRANDAITPAARNATAATP